MNSTPTNRPMHKFNAKRTDYDGIRFDSKKEAQYYAKLKMRVSVGQVLFFLRQTAFHLPGGVKYSVDFTEFHADGTVHFVDVKGMKTKEFILKKKMVEDLYPVEIEVV